MRTYYWAVPSYRVMPPPTGQGRQRIMRPLHADVEVASTVAALWRKCQCRDYQTVRADSIADAHHRATILHARKEHTVEFYPEEEQCGEPDSGGATARDKE